MQKGTIVKIIEFLLCCIGFIDIIFNVLDISTLLISPTNYRKISAIRDGQTGFYISSISDAQFKKLDVSHCQFISTSNSYLMMQEDIDLFNNMGVRILYSIFFILCLIFSFISIVFALLQKQFPFCYKSIPDHYYFIFIMYLSFLTLPFRGYVIGYQFSQECVHKSLLNSFIRPVQFVELSLIPEALIIVLSCIYSRCFGNGQSGKLQLKYLCIIGMGFLFLLLTILISGIFAIAAQIAFLEVHTICIILFATLFDIICTCLKYSQFKELEQLKSKQKQRQNHQNLSVNILKELYSKPQLESKNALQFISMRSMYGRESQTNFNLRILGL